MRVLLYGFKPYGDYTENISEQILSRIAETDTVIKKVYDVRFDADMFGKTMAKIRPDRILGLGQHPRARKLRIERKAKNLRKSEGQTLVPISESGPSCRYATLELPQTALTTVTYDAGTYVCNYSMYLTGQYCGQSGARFGFVHIPKDQDLVTLSAWLKRVLDKITAD